MSTHRRTQDPKAAQLAAFHRRVAGTTSAIIGPVLLLAGLIAGSPWLAVIGGLMFAIPAVAKIFKGSTKPVKPPKPSRYARYRTWRENLTPEQRLAWDLSVAAGMTAAHVAWSHHNQRVSAHLTASVMGDAPYNDVHAGMKHMTAQLGPAAPAAFAPPAPPAQPYFVQVDDQFGHHLVPRTAIHGRWG